MKRLHLFIILICILICTSCATRLYTTKSNFAMNIEDEKRFDVNEFEIYVFNICEKYAPTVDPVERFCKCPDNFFDVAKQDSIRKIEEVYFLIHKTKR